MEAIRRRHDTDDCGCLRCRSLDPTLLRRSLGGDLLWGARLLVRRPSIPLLALSFFLLIGLANPLLARTRQPVTVIDIPIQGVIFLALVGIVLRSYTAAETAALLTDSASTPGYSLRRAPAVAAVLALTLVVAFAVMGVVSLVVWYLLQAAFAVDGALGLSIVSDTIFDGPHATLLFGSVMAIAALKFWLAPEIAVVGGYAPWTAMRLSWSMTRAHRWRLLVVVLGFAATTFGPGFLSTAAGGVTPPIPGLDLVGFYLQALLAAAWFAVGTQIYLRGAVADPAPRSEPGPSTHRWDAQNEL